MQGTCTFSLKGVEIQSYYGMRELPEDGITEGQNAEYYVSSLFLKKGGNKKCLDRDI